LLSGIKEGLGCGESLYPEQSRNTRSPNIELVSSSILMIEHAKEKF
jgi:hypothetical protein